MYLIELCVIVMSNIPSMKGNMRGEPQMKKLSIYFALVVVLFLGGCSSDQPSEGAGEADGEATVNYVAPTELVSLDSTLLDEMNSANYVAHMQEGLYWEDEQNNIIPALAEELPEISDDGLTYTIKMREDAEWSDGTPITAHDQVFAIQRLVDPDVAATYSYLAENIVNAPEVIAGELPVEELGVTAPDDYTVQIELTTPTPYLTNLLAFSVFFPLNQEYVESQGEDYGTTSEHVLASGPFTIDGWDTTQETWTLNKNDNYYNASEVNIDTVNVQVMKEVSTNVNLYEAGQVDNALLTGELAKQYQDHPEAVTQEKARTYWLRFNNNIEALNNQKFREAIDYAIDNQELTDVVIGTGSYPISTLIPTGFIFNPETEEDFTEEMNLAPKFDEEKASELWQEAQAELGVDNLTLRLVTDDEEHIQKISEYIQGQIQNTLPGVTIELQNIPKKNRLDSETNRDYDLILTSWAADFASGINFYELYESDSIYNRGDYSNAEYDALIAANKGEDANDPVASWENFKQAQQILSDETAIVPLYQEVEVQLRNPALQGITLRAVGTEFDLRTAYFEE